MGGRINAVSAFTNPDRGPQGTYIAMSRGVSAYKHLDAPRETVERGRANVDFIRLLLSFNPHFPLARFKQTSGWGVISAKFLVFRAAMFKVSVARREEGRSNRGAHERERVFAESAYRSLSAWVTANTQHWGG